jgi:ABC-type transport system involved in multi-copper enzyme maturation permease subunit
MKVWILARQVVADAADDRVFVTIGLYGAVVAGLAPLVSGMALAAGTRAVADLGWLLLWLVACWVGCWLGIRAVGLDLHHRTAALVLSRPISASTWSAGRLLGVVLALGVQIGGMLAIWVVIAGIWGVSIGVDWVWAGLLLWAEASVTAALAALLSTLVAPVFAAASTAGLWIAGHLAQEYARVAAESDLAWAATLLFVFVPDLDRFNVQDALVHGVAIPPIAALSSLAYAVVWIAVLQGLTVWVVTRRDLA